jgi:hypothetical protein
MEEIKLNLNPFDQFDFTQFGAFLHDAEICPHPFSRFGR